jgi:hypothetical protein
MKNGILIAAALLITAAAGAEASAQISMPRSIPGTGNTNSNAGNIGESQTTFFRNFQSSYVDIATAQAFLMDALNDREQAAALRTQIASVQGGSTDRDVLRRAVELSAQASETIGERTARGETLSAESRALFVQALPHLIRGTMSATRLPAEAQAFGSSAQAAIGSAGMLERARLTQSLSGGVYLASNLPGYVSTTADVYRRIISFAGSNNIAVPADGTALLGTLE